MNSLTRWDPFRTMTTLQDQISRLFDLGHFPRTDNASLSLWAPSVDVLETENSLLLKADLPGMDEKDLDVRIENNMLTISGERKSDQSVKEDNFLRLERVSGSFSRSFSLPNTVNTDAIHAEYKNGVLTVELPKRAEAKPKQVKVQVATAR